MIRGFYKNGNTNKIIKSNKIKKNVHLQYFYFRIGNIVIIIWAFVHHGLGEKNIRFRLGNAVNVRAGWWCEHRVTKPINVRAGATDGPVDRHQTFFSRNIARNIYF